MSTKAAPREFTGRHMLILIIAFFSVVIGVNVTMAVFSSTTWTGLVVQNSYVASQEFQVKRDRARLQDALGWKGQFTYADGKARFAITDGASALVTVDGVHLLLHRPVGGHDDKTLDMVRALDGAFVADVVLDPGVWDAQILVDQTAEGPFEHQHRFTVK